MRRIGSGLMVLGLFLLLVSLFVEETGGVRGSGGALHAHLLFYGGAAACLLGAIIFSARKLFGRP
jgi:hypothetical protein